MRERWKEPVAGSEIESETGDLQTVEVRKDDGVSFGEGAYELLCDARLNDRSHEAVREIES